jgi:uncharacterized protein with HEPN domain
MQREACGHLYSAQQACRRVQQFITGKSFADYLADEILSSAVERKFEIIGEALNQAMRLEPSLRDHIAKFRPFVAFRNVITHQYATVQHDIVWTTAERDVAPLLAVLDGLLASADPDAGVGKGRCE